MRLNKTDNSPKEKKTFLGLIRSSLTFLRRLVTYKLLIKVLSVFFAMLLWGYIVTQTNPETKKTFAKIPVKIVGEDVMNSSGFASTVNTSDLFPNGIKVEIGVGMREYNNVTSASIEAVLDISQISKTGKRRVDISVRSLNPDVTIKSFSPSRIELNIDKYGEKNINIGKKYTGEMPANMWRDEAKLYPGIVTISGPQKIINSIAHADVVINQASLKASMNGNTYPLVYSDSKGNTIKTNVIKASSSIGVTMSVKAKRDLKLDLDSSLQNATLLSEGFEIVDKSYTYPNESNIITLLGSEEALSKVGNKLICEAIDLNGKNESVLSVPRKLILPDGVEAVHGNTVYVTVNITEKTLTKTLNAPIKFTTPKNWKYSVASFSVPRINVNVTGPYNSVMNMGDDALTAQVDLTNLSAGTHKVPITLTGYQKGVSCSMETTSIEVKIERKK